MQRIVTLTERNTAEAARRATAVEALVPVLTEYASNHGGRFLLFGFAARGPMKFDSNVDLLMDFPPAAPDEAWKFAEAVCWDRVLEPDLLWRVQASIPGRHRAQHTGACMSDTRWHESTIPRYQPCVISQGRL